MDHYKVLGLSRTATKDQIKDAFRKMAIQFHPDKHSLSPKSVKDDATRRFKQISEAYEVLMDDRKRADYNIRSYNNHNNRSTSSSGYQQRSNTGSSSYGYGYQSGANYGYGYARNESNVSRFEVYLRYMSTRSFLINLAFSGVLLGGSYFISSSGDALWKMHNPGKSFDEVMESIEKAKAVRDDKTR